MATPFNGTITFENGNGTTSYNAYASDASGLLRYSKSGTAGTASPDFILVKNGAYITGMDFASSATMVSLTINFDDAPQQTLRFADILNTLATRTKLKIWIPAGTKLTMNQA